MALSKQLLRIGMIALMFASLSATGYAAGGQSSLDLTPIQHAKKVRVFVEQVYLSGEHRLENVSLPLKDVISRAGRYAGFEVVPTGSDEYDATIRVNITGEALLGSYGTNIGVSKGTRYSGAAVSGSIKVEGYNGPPIIREFKQIVMPLRSVGENDYIDPNGAPFVMAGGFKFLPTTAQGYSSPHATHFVATFLDLIRDIYGAITLVDMLRETRKREWKLRDEICYSIARPQKAEVVPLLSPLLQIDRPWLRQSVIKALGLIGAPEAIEPLKRQMFSENVSINYEWNIPEALARIDDPRAADALISGLSSEYGHLDSEIVDALVKKPDPRATPILIDACTSGRYVDNSYMKSKYATALRAITGQDFGTDFAKWKEWLAEKKDKTHGGVEPNIGDSPQTSNQAESGGFPIHPSVGATEVLNASQDPETILPPYKSILRGPNEVRLKNPNDFGVTAGIRKGQYGTNFYIPANGRNSVYIPDGRYEIYFVYSSNPDGLFKGDSFTLVGNGVEIQIVKIVGGNYGIRRIK